MAGRERIGGVCSVNEKRDSGEDKVGSGEGDEHEQGEEYEQVYVGGGQGEDDPGKDAVFKFTCQRNAEVLRGNFVSCFMRNLKLGFEDYLFCKLGSGGEVFSKDFLRHSEGRVSLVKEQKSLGRRGCRCTVGGHRGVDARGGQARLSAGL